MVKKCSYPTLIALFVSCYEVSSLRSQSEWRDLTLTTLTTSIRLNRGVLLWVDIFHVRN